MSKDKKVPVEKVIDVGVDEPMPVATPATPPTVSTPSMVSLATKLTDLDKMALDLARSKRQVALAEAKTALANNENAEMAYKYLILQIYMKYGLTEADALSEAGDIVRGGAVPRPQGQ